MAARTKRAVAEPEELEDELETVEEEDEDLDELEEEPAPRKRAAKKAAPAAKTGDIKGVAWLAEYVNETLDKSVSTTSLRVILRKMATEGELEREIGTERSRYSFTGPKDPAVREIVKRIKAGALERSTTDNLAAAREAKKAKAAAAAEEEEAPAPSRRKTRKTVEAEELPAAPAKKATRKRAS